ncbi:sulfotransferase family 2 domain-containing protein [Serinicoccus kebangsaanensis]|uniref:sulfotransferase family 2 domain-containing protein n=1 Tax=Serinicoccus kebangsaanensis TaxID=2602069 RepID=UPI00178C18AB|nr:sulfotransferase family 2 domain-containing protein [Serinicoccus kebangsaanensis]
MRRHELPPHKTATYVLPDKKLVYVSVPKAACTSLKWLVADLQGESRARFYTTLSEETGRSMTVHRRSRWQHTPMLHQLDEDQLAEITPDNGWFVFGVVRHPASRFWSGWQSKMLLHEPRFVRRYPDAQWPRIPSTSSDVEEDFARFSEVLDSPEEQPILRDRHFMRQTDLLRLGTTPYDRIYQTSEMGQLLTDLAEHLRPLGVSELPEMPHSNETPLRPTRSVLSPAVLERINRYYADDMERFGFDPDNPSGMDQRESYPDSELVEISRLVERGERIGDLAKMATSARRERAKLAQRVKELEGAAPASAKAPVSVPATRTRRRVAGAARSLARRAVRRLSR